MNVIYSLSTLPHFSKRSDTFKLDKFELYTAAISSLTRRHDGDYTIMHCDTRGAEFFERIGLAGLWNEIRLTIPDDFENINPRMFWAAGKLFALRETPAPLLMLDTDFIAWDLPPLGNNIVAAHRESLNPATYPPIEHFRMRSGYEFNPAYNYSAMPLNTAFLYLPDEEFKQYYTDCAINFMKSAWSCEDFLCYMVYAEQRLLAMCAEYRNRQADTLFEFDNRYNQSIYTHTWGAKQIMRDNPHELMRFCEKCKLRIKRDFPEWEYVIELIEKG
ncbi:MAG: hypothetical protein FWD34_08185 [Oscillospiraceae bacterium]|nr:hypothetical protein [Oscillospiraceae bacterium]